MELQANQQIQMYKPQLVQTPQGHQIKDNIFIFNLKDESIKSIKYNSGWVEITKTNGVNEIYSGFNFEVVPMPEPKKDSGIVKPKFTLPKNKAKF